ncbi:hypothetical protein ZWY2020_003910 [Hordeum vulgare]|nr:hypothetical protein ZWY2020_003910 [Hordeum vulgare]
MPRVLVESVQHLAAAPAAAAAGGLPAHPPQSSASPPPPAPTSPPPPTPPPKSPPPSSPPPASSGNNQSPNLPPGPGSPPPVKSPTSSPPPPASPPPSTPPTSRSPPPSSPPPPSPPSQQSSPPPAQSTPPSPGVSTQPSPKASTSRSQQSPPTSPPASPPPSQPKNPAPAIPTPSPPLNAESAPAGAGTSPPPLQTPVPAAAGQVPAAPGTPSSASLLPPPGIMPTSGPPPGTWQSPPRPAVAKASPPAPAPPTRSSAENLPTGVIVGVAVAGFLMALASLFMVACLSDRGKKRHPPMRKRRTTVVPARVPSPDSYPPSYGPAASPSGASSYEFSGYKSCFTYDELAGITGGFSADKVIGEGGFGKVYMGALGDGRRVAVKQLKVGGGHGEKEFRAEVDIISRIHHRHLVTLVGYCVTENHRLLVYEFVSNDTLEHHLHGQGLPVMDWPKRMKIAIGSARGLTYLHEDCHPRIIHRDIKSANILLDDAFEAKVADFGLAKLTNDAMTHVSTRVMGTFGYMAPEYASSGKLTDRSDVFSFGVVLLELITGRKPVDSSQPIGEESLVEWARPLLVDALETDDFREIADPALELRYSKTEMRRMVEAAASCIRHSGTKRPRMVQVWRSLDVDGGSTDLTNGVKLGHSTAYDSGQYSADIELFRRMAFETDLDSAEYGLSGEGEPRPGSGRQQRTAAGR